MTTVLIADPFVVRKAEQGDTNYIRSSWLREYGGSEWARAVGPHYMKDHHAVIERLLKRSAVKIAGLEDIPSAICGWVCFEPTRIHFVYVKPRYRRLGLARRLLEPFAKLVDATYTHRTKLLNTLPVPAHWQFHPYEAVR